MDTPTMKIINSRPTTMSSQSFDFGLILRQISIVKMALLELKIEVKEDMSDAIITASIRPLNNQSIKIVLKLYCKTAF